MQHAVCNIDRPKFQNAIHFTPEREAEGIAAHNARLIKEAIYWARTEGDRVIAAGTTIWKGIPGGHPFDSRIEVMWAESGAEFERVLRALPSGTHIEIQTYRARHNAWGYIKSFTLL